jgi:hypothetical protein
MPNSPWPVTIKIFPAREILVSDVPAEDGKIVNLFYSVLYLLYVLHPLGHLLVAHVVHLLDEVVVLLPERHLRAGRGLPVHKT